MTSNASNTTAGPPGPTPGAEPAAHPAPAVEADLLRRARDGQPDALGELVVRYQDRVYNLMARMVGPGPDAEELAQEAFLKAFEKLHSFRGHSRFYTWLFRIAANLAISHRRRKTRLTFTSLTRRDDDGERQNHEPTAELAARRTPAPDARIIGRETAERLAAAMDALDEDFRVVVVLRDIENMDYAQIGEVLNLPPGTVKSRLHRARNMLRTALAETLGKEP